MLLVTRYSLKDDQVDRIGIAASKIARGNVFLYNVTVILLIFVFAVFIFILAGASVMLALIIVGFLVEGLLPQDFLKDWNYVIAVCMAALTVVVSFLSILAFIRNIKLNFLTKDRKDETN
jgi:hypothetical protein